MSCWSNCSSIFSVDPWVSFYQQLCPHRVFTIRSWECHVNLFQKPRAVFRDTLFMLNSALSLGSFSFTWDQKRWGGSPQCDWHNLDSAPLWESPNLVSPRSFGEYLVASWLVYGQRGWLQQSNQTLSLWGIVAHRWHGTEYVILTRTECEHFQLLNFLKSD